MVEGRRLLVFATLLSTAVDLTRAAERAGLAVTRLDGTVADLVARWQPGDAVRAPGGLVAGALADGAALPVVGPTPWWFVGLDRAVTRRTWHLLDRARVSELLRTAPAFVKLPDSKDRRFPARVFPSADDFAAAASGLGPTVPHDDPRRFFLASTDLLDICSEYRVFTLGRRATTVSPYLVEGDPWTPLLPTHRASFHESAAEHVEQWLGGLDDHDVPPAAAIDVARLGSGRFVMLEANQAWSSATYGCDADEVLRTVLAANPHPWDPGLGRWRWQPDPPSRAGRGMSDTRRRLGCSPRVRAQCPGVPSIVGSVTFDAVDALVLGRFWAAALGSDVDEDATSDRASVDPAGWGWADPLAPRTCFGTWDCRRVRSASTSQLTYSEPSMSWRAEVA